jgi:hypothetical protein
MLEVVGIVAPSSKRSDAHYTIHGKEVPLGTDHVTVDGG